MHEVDHCAADARQQLLQVLHLDYLHASAYLLPAKAVRVVAAADGHINVGACKHMPTHQTRHLDQATVSSLLHSDQGLMSRLEAAATHVQNKWGHAIRPLLRGDVALEQSELRAGQEGARSRICH